MDHSMQNAVNGWQALYVVLIIYISAISQDTNLYAVFHECTKKQLDDVVLACECDFLVFLEIYISLLSLHLCLTDKLVIGHV